MLLFNALEEAVTIVAASSFFLFYSLLYIGREFILNMGWAFPKPIS